MALAPCTSHPSQRNNIPAFAESLLIPWPVPEYVAFTTMSKLRKEGDACAFTRKVRPSGLREFIVTLECLHYRFDWTKAWASLHTLKELVPDHCKEVFFLFHVTGSVKVSEQLCESLASVLKYLGKDRPSAATESIVSKCIMRVSGLTGATAENDLLIQRMWCEVAGVDSVDKIRFHVKDRKQREKRFPLGHGSKTLHSFTLKMRAKNKISFSPRQMRRVLRPRSGQTASLHMWRRHAREQRMSSKS